MRMTGAKARGLLLGLSARLKSCPCYKTVKRVFPQPLKSCPDTMHRQVPSHWRIHCTGGFKYFSKCARMRLNNSTRASFPAMECVFRGKTWKS